MAFQLFEDIYGSFQSFEEMWKNFQLKVMWIVLVFWCVIWDVLVVGRE